MARCARPSLQTCLGSAAVQPGLTGDLEVFLQRTEHPVCMEVFYHSGKVALSGLFTWIEYNWKDSHPGLEPAQMAERVYGKVVSRLDLALVFADSAAADDPNKVDNAFAREVARYMATELPNDRRWERPFELDDPRWRGVVAYRNKSADRHSYLRSLETDLGSNPSLPRLSKITSPVLSDELK